MLNHTNSLPITSTMTVFRMRERGPIESHKIGKFNQDSSTDIKLLEKHFTEAYANLKQYIQSTITGCEQSLSIGENGTEIFSSKPNVTNDIINNNKNNLLISNKGVR